MRTLLRIALNDRTIELMSNTPLREHECWPIHPQPLKAESLESWVARQAYANGYTVNTFVRTYLRSRLRDFDFLSRTSEAFRLISETVDGGGGRTLQTTLPWLETELGLKQPEGDWLIPVWRAGRRYCAICLSSDTYPYFRLIWRVKLIPICLDHNVYLESQCKKCVTPASIWSLRRYQSIGECRKCGSVLSEASGQAVRPLGDMNKEIAELLGNVKTFWPYRTGLLNAVSFVLRLLKAKERRETTLRALSEIQKSGGPEEGGPETKALMLKAWSLLEDFPNLFEAFVAENRQVLDDINWHRCPRVFVKFRPNLR